MIQAQSLRARSDTTCIKLLQPAWKVWNDCCDGTLSEYRLPQQMGISKARFFCELNERSSSGRES